MTINLTRRNAVLGILATGLAGTASAQATPLKIVVPWAPGGSTDAIGRAR